MSVLDVGCGAGGALVVARKLGAAVSGLDAASTLVAIARRRLPGARIDVGDMEALPFDDGSFDVVTSFNAFQFAGDVGRALSEARRTCRRAGTVAMLVWGRRDECDLVRAIVPAVLALLPPAPSAAAPIAFAEPGVIEGLMRAAGLAPNATGIIECPFVYRDADMAWRAISAAAPCVRAIAHVGEDAVKRALLPTFAPFTDASGAIRLDNRFRWVTATRA
jgi:SAM-dependent methyltransferase